jgi:ABC-2 type transport system permease protein
MKKIFLIGWKDVKLAFRDRTALIFMLAAPFALTIGMGLITGSFGTQNTNVISNIAVVVVNLDKDTLGNALVDTFQSEQLSDLFTVEIAQDPESAYAVVNKDDAAAAVIIPAGFTDSIIAPAGPTQLARTVKLELYSNPNRPNGSGIVQTIVSSFLSQVEIRRVGVQVSITQMIANGIIQPEQAAKYVSESGFNQANLAASQRAIIIKGLTPSGEMVDFNILAYMAPGYALLFLMYTAINGGRMLLVEKTQGTLPRLLVTPTTSSQILTGKMVGTYLTGVLQLLILIVGSTLLFQIKWGDPLAVFFLVLAAVAGAVGWGMLITALIKTPGQATSVGSATMLTFGVLGGSFFDLGALPSWIGWLSKITPNAWGQEGFLTLALGGSLAEIWKPITALIIMGLILFILAILLLKRREFAKD